MTVLQAMGEGYLLVQLFFVPRDGQEMGERRVGLIFCVTCKQTGC